MQFFSYDWIKLIAKVLLPKILNFSFVLEMHAYEKDKIKITEIG